MNRSIRRTGSLVAWMATLGLTFAGCASSGGQKESSTAAADDSAAAEETADESETQEERGERGRMEVRKRVHFEEILGKEVRGETPPGCTGEWDPLESTSYPGDGYTCTEFNGPDRWGEPPVTMMVDGGELSAIVVQLFYDGPDEARSEFNNYTGNLLDRCERKTGFNRSMVLNCDDYFVDVRWAPGHDQAMVKIVYAASLDILKQGRN